MRLVGEAERLLDLLDVGRLGRYFLTPNSVNVATVATPSAVASAASLRHTAFFSASAARRAKPGCEG